MAALFDDGTRGATVSDDGRYRYDLWRRWGDGPLLGFVMLNPSVADADVDDPTIRRCIGYAEREGCAGVVVRNLFCYRTPKPQVLVAAMKAGVDVVGPDADDWLRRLADDRFGVKWVVGGWGAANFVGVAERVAVVKAMLGRRLWTIDANYDGTIRTMTAAPHPLYLPGEAPLVPYPSD